MLVHLFNKYLWSTYRMRGTWLCQRKIFCSHQLTFSWRRWTTGKANQSSVHQSCSMLEWQVLWRKKERWAAKGGSECLEVGDGALGLQVKHDGQQRLPGEVTLKQILKEGEGISHVVTGGRVSQTDGEPPDTGPTVGEVCHVWETAKRPVAGEV